MHRRRIVDYLDTFLNVDGISDNSQNGLQVEGRATVNRVAVAVDACLKTIRRAARMKADMLIVHHGLLWGRNERITGVMRKRVGALIDNDISLYTAHLPLDIHDVVGNNAEIARLLGFQPLRRFGRYRGADIGFVVEVPDSMARSTLVSKVDRTLKTRSNVLSFGPPRVKRIAIVSGGAAELAPEAKEQGCDTYITGETSHVGYHLAKEAGINVIFAGHYASETVGVRALGRHLQRKYALTCKFISDPTGF
jgi:dinuclear metal center YbgI/SA1388 family protein